VKSDDPSNDEWREFQSAVEVIEPTPAKELRSRWVDGFVDQLSDFYRKHIRDWRQAYRGYLWDCLSSSQVVSEAVVWDRAESMDRIS